jgi:polyisoprenoid-binding protein YceI
MSPVRIALIAVLVVALGAAAFAGWYLFLRPAPAAVSLATPAATVAGGAGATGAAGSAVPAGDLSGTWKVDTSVGSFADFTSSFVGYRVQETLGTIGANTAVGRTPNVSGTLTLDGTTITAVDITADLTSLQSDNSMRDGQLRRQSIQTGTFPTSTFKLTSPIELGSVPADGTPITTTATGELTLHGQTKTVQVPIQAQLSGSVVTVVGSLPIVFADYGIEKPASQLVLSIDDHGIMEFQLHFTKA